MASVRSQLKISHVCRDATLLVTITGWRRFAIRVYIVGKLLRLAVWFLGLRDVEFVIEGLDPMDRSNAANLARRI